ncbi:hypothetical protein PVAND_015519 [Polypedilum vanderplanki]|uniref:Uncharacterized protein n=1 Tax=Polypedilum vanderplanki TaxID=319348 RepID=A0A9J6BCG9_POLVA|nr:hypothetical protein PVAND_015519 [Polypedilum vanderplanki]
MEEKKSGWSQRTGLEKGLIVGVVFLALAAIGLLVGLIVVAVQDNSSDDLSNVCLTEGCILTAHSLNQNMKPDLDPCDDFYEYACGRFLDEKVIPDDKTGITAFSEIENVMRDHLRIIINEPVNANEIKPFRDLKLLNQACLNLQAIEELGHEPVLSKIRDMGGWPALFMGEWDDSQWSWEKVIADFRKYGYSVGQIFAFSVTTDQQNSIRRIGRIDQTSLGLNYEYIIKKENDTFYLAYKSYQVDLAKLFGSTLTQEQLEAKMSEALEFEYQLANISLPREERRDANLLYNPMSITELQSKYPYIQWLDYLNSLMPDDTKFTENDIIINAVPTFFEKLGPLLAATPNEVIANYLMWRFAASSVSYMPKEFRDRQQEYNKITTGKETPDPRGLVCSDVTLNYFAHALGSLYVRKHFKEEAKENVMEMVANLKVAFKEILDEIDWMDENTKKAAHDKADAMKSQMAYADELLDDTKLVEYYQNIDAEIDVNNYYESIFRLNIASTKYSLSRLRQPVDKDDWAVVVTPAIVNAFYSSLENTIKFPAGILQGAFFNADRPHYMNYGAIGFVIGHEITHGFDDQGSRYDAIGNLNNWWDNTTRANFESRAKCLIDQYTSYKDEQTGLNLNGINTQGENIADNGGIKESYRAYEKLIEKIGEEKLLPGIELNQKQLFWVSAAQVWCSVHRDEALINRIQTGVHSPGQFRVIGPLRNRPEFAKDFECKDISLMNPKDEDRCSVW